MTWLVKHKLAAGIAAVVVWLLWSNRKAVAASLPQVIRGRIDSGNSFGYFDVNPDSPTFGDPVFGTYGWED